MSRLLAPLAAAAMVGGGLPSTRFGQIAFEPDTGANTTAPNPSAGIAQFDQATLDAAIERTLQARLAAERAASGQQPTPQLNPDAGREAAPEGGRSATAIGEGGEVLTNPADRRFVSTELARLFRGLARRNEAQQADAVDNLARRGYYGEAAQTAVAQGQRAMSTLTDPDGGVFLPTVVLNEVLRIVPTYGVIRRICRVITGVTGRIRIPNVTATLTAFWVGEGAEIKARQAAFNRVELDPEKIGLIVPFSTELEDEAGAGFMDLLIALIAEAFGKLEDETALYGTGAAVYGGITGVANAAGVNSYVLPATKTTFKDVTYDDLIGVFSKAPAAVRFTGTWVLHPDAMIYVAKMKDTTGRPIYIPAGGSIEFDTLLGRPVQWTQAANSDATASQAGKPLGFYGDWSKFILAQGRQMTTEVMDQATIKDVNDTTDIRLGSQDMKALKTTQTLDMLVAVPEAFVKILTANA